MRRDRAASRARTLTSRESHSSTSRSSPSKNSSMVFSVMPSSAISTRRYGSISAMRRAATTALLTPRSSMDAGILLRLESSISSKSARRSVPQIPSSARVWAMACPTLSPMIPIVRSPKEFCSARVILFLFLSSLRCRNEFGPSTATTVFRHGKKTHLSLSSRRLCSGLGSSECSPFLCVFRSSRNVRVGSRLSSSRAARCVASVSSNITGFQWWSGVFRSFMMRLLPGVRRLRGGVRAGRPCCAASGARWPARR